jgi:hypothetical protein
MAVRLRPMQEDEFAAWLPPMQKRYATTRERRLDEQEGLAL